MNIVFPLPGIVSESQEKYCSVLSFNDNNQLNYIDFYQGSCRSALKMSQRSSWIVRQAESGDAEAQWALYLSTYGIKDATALKWLCRAADQGHSWASGEIGRFYRDGTYIDPDPSKSYVWYAHAAQSGLVNAADELAKISATMSAEELSRANILLAEWQPGQCEREFVPNGQNNKATSHQSIDLQVQ